jgi:breast cancer 2 susceptibility protein
MKAGPNFKAGEDDFPDHIDGLYDELEEPSDASAVMRRVTPKDAGWLAQYIRKRLESDVEKVREEIQQELQVWACSVIYISIRLTECDLISK